MPVDNPMETTPSTYSPLPLLSRLSAMMFLQYFVQGAYLPIASVYVQDALGFTAMQVGVFSSALAVGPFLAPFVIGQIVDRMFATERVMAFCHLAGGLLMLAIYTQTDVWPVILLGTAYSILYVPTMMLSNSLAFQHLKNSDMEFPWIRAFGTLGFIIPAYVIEFWWLRGLQGESLDRARAFAFALSGIVGIVMAIYCLSLPHTPAQHREDRKYAPGVVVSMLRSRHFFVLILVSFFIAMAHQFVVVWYSPFLRAILDTGGWGAYEQSISSVGQICELAVLAILGLLIKRLGFKWTMLLGLAAYMLRCLLFSLVFALDLSFTGKLILAAAGQALHGFCFGCFLAVAYMYVDRIAPRDARGSMQTLYGTFVIALGFFAGGFASGQIGDWFTTGAEQTLTRDWTSIWLSCTALCAACLVVFAVWFPRRLPEPGAGSEE
ncbi:MAG: nucleoside permease [Rhodopirellula sp.]|nr:nucleoside permease [Rhodopirellula sp.]